MGGEKAWEDMEVFGAVDLDVLVELALGVFAAVFLDSAACAMRRDGSEEVVDSFVWWATCGTGNRGDRWQQMVETA